MKTKNFFDWNIVTPQPSQNKENIFEKTYLKSKRSRVQDTNVEIRSGSCPKLSYTKS